MGQQIDLTKPGWWQIVTSKTAQAIEKSDLRNFDLRFFRSQHINRENVIGRAVVDFGTAPLNITIRMLIVKDSNGNPNALVPSTKGARKSQRGNDVYFDEVRFRGLNSEQNGAMRSAIATEYIRLKEAGELDPYWDDNQQNRQENSNAGMVDAPEHAAAGAADSAKQPEETQQDSPAEEAQPSMESESKDN